MKVDDFFCIFFVKFDDFFFFFTALNVITNFLNSNNDNVVNNTILFYELDEISFWMPWTNALSIHENIKIRYHLQQHP